ncbi:MAG TPA: transcription antitermination factor NusB [Candidatus Omnitrophota bacterium]|nr:transcription antitermination factor NusB [Candidatus Omnitrophota bacterium]HPS36480.1 transcription antitermination factor NusB [Candidatus Omnitrophota bacterium]
MIRKRTQARECALQALYQHEINPEPFPELFKRFWGQHEESFSQEIRNFTEALVQGTSDHLPEIDEVITRYADNWELSRMAIIDRNIMRFGVYELLFLADIPPKVTINEAVNLAKKFSQEESGKFVNGILDKINHTEKPRNPKNDAAPEA